MRYLPYVRYVVPVLLVGYVLAQALVLSYPLAGTSQLHDRTNLMNTLLGSEVVSYRENDFLLNKSKTLFC